MTTPAIKVGVLFDFDFLSCYYPEELKDSLLLSPEARSFIVAKSFDLTGRWYRPAADSFLPGCLIFYHYVLGVKINETFGLMQRPRPLRLSVQAIWAVAVIILGLFLMSEARLYCEQASFARRLYFQHKNN